MMIVLKVFNNNSVVALTNDKRDVILMGKGVGFQTKAGDVVDESKIEKTYVFQDEHKTKFEKTLSSIPTLYFEITESIVHRAVTVLKTDFSSEIFLAIAEHISFAIKRKRQGIDLADLIMSETKVLYKEEYKIGQWAVSYIAKKTGVILEEDEAGYIALHLANFSLSNQNNRAGKIVLFTRDILVIIQHVMKVELKEDSIEYMRLTVHLKYLAGKIIQLEKVSIIDTTHDLRELLKSDTRLALCINRIVKHIKQHYDYDLSPDEQTYLCIHIKRNVRENM